MIAFATEFPVKNTFDRAIFVAEVIAWLRGVSSSTILTSYSEKELDQENVHLKSSSGEELRLRELRSGEVLEAIGFRHDIPDHDGRLWRTEGVLRQFATDSQQSIVRFRTQCIALVPGAYLTQPRKPYIIKSILNNAFGEEDKELPVSDRPIFLDETEDSLETARQICVGSATKALPVIYISAISDTKWILSEAEIVKLTYDLGGVAHVVVEPSRSFSFRLRDISKGQNVYGGNIGICSPNQGIIRRYYLGWNIQEIKDLISNLKLSSINIRSRMPALGWGWTEIQEQALRAQRIKETNRLTAAESEKLYLEEIENLQDKIQQLEQQISSLTSNDVSDRGAELSNKNISEVVGPEIYSGEIFDRLRLAAKHIIIAADGIGLDKRSLALLNRFLEKLPASPALKELLQDLDRATKDPKRISIELSSLLCRHGFEEKSDNKHIRLQSIEGFDGLESVTIAKTPSEHRGLKNQKSQIINVLGVGKLNF